MARNAAHSGGKGGALGCDCVSRPTVQKGGLEVGQAWPGLGTQAGVGGQVGRAGPENVSFSVWMKTMPLSRLAPC